MHSKGEPRRSAQIPNMANLEHEQFAGLIDIEDLKNNKSYYRISQEEHIGNHITTFSRTNCLLYIIIWQWVISMTFVCLLGLRVNNFPTRYIRAIVWIP